MGIVAVYVTSICCATTPARDSSDGWEADLSDGREARTGEGKMNKPNTGQYERRPTKHTPPGAHLDPLAGKSLAGPRTVPASGSR